MDYIIDKMSHKDWHQVRGIYIQGIRTGNSTFEIEAPSWEEWDEKHIPSCRLVARKGDDVWGWAALSPVSYRPFYSGVAEVSVYIGAEHRGKGIGTSLLKMLIELSEENGFWTLEALIFPENKPSLALHRKCGFREVGVREKMGRMKDGTWRDVMLLERRSPIVGID